MVTEAALVPAPSPGRSRRRRGLRYCLDAAGVLKIPEEKQEEEQEEKIPE
jgi:hypothetical protein